MTMAKKNGFNPFVFSTVMLSGEEAGVIGGGTGQGGLAPRPVSYSDWLTSPWAEDYDFNGNGEYEWTEYAYWWQDQNFTMDAWNELNPGHDWPLP